MIFKSKSNSQKSYLNGRRIGVLGLSPRCGATHIAVAISNYLSEAEKKRVTLFERNRNDDIQKLTAKLGAKDTDPFTYHRVTYVPSPVYSSETIPDIEADCMVFDLGSDFRSGMRHLLLCDIKIIVGTDAVWREEEYEKLTAFTSNYGTLSSWRLFINLGDTKRLKEKDRYGMTVCCFPYEPDPVYPGKDTENFLKEAIYG